MRLKALLAEDVRFQLKYGFYFVYAVFTVLYITLLAAIPDAWKERVTVLLVFSDPAAMGLYFMGAIILLERSGRTLNSLAVSPVKPWELTVSKLSSIAVISVLVAVLIAAFSGKALITVPFVFGVLLGSCMFSAVGLMIAAKSLTLNNFILSTIPAELVINVPAIAYLFGWNPRWLLLHPGVSMIELCLNGKVILPAALILALWTALTTAAAIRAVSKMMTTMGGIKL